MAGSSALMRLTVWEYCLISRSLRLPKIFLSRPDIIAMKGGCAGRGKGLILTCPHPAMMVT